MKILPGFAALLWFTAIGLAGDPSLVFYVQLVRGSDQDSLQQASWKPLGPKLSEQLCPKFRWKNYWEVNRKTLNVQPGQPVRVRLSQEREIEIELRTAEESEIRLFTAGKLVRRSRQPTHSRMTIMGGGGDKAECWFVVVRRDKPSVD